MPFFTTPAIYAATPYIDKVMISRQDSLVRTWKKKIIEVLLRTNQGSILVKMGSCDLKTGKVDTEVSEEALNKLRHDLGSLGIATTIITGEKPIQGRYPLYLFCTNNLWQDPK